MKAPNKKYKSEKLAELRKQEKKDRKNDLII
jgi:hypothetical protein